ncbi:MAG: hypothetical protein ACLTE2_10415 [Eubacteriales bacterium]
MQDALKKLQNKEYPLSSPPFLKVKNNTPNDFVKKKEQYDNTRLREFTVFNSWLVKTGSMNFAAKLPPMTAKCRHCRRCRLNSLVKGFP